MKIVDFERAMPSHVRIDAFKCVLGEVVACVAHIGAQRILFDTNGKAFGITSVVRPEDYVAFYDEDLTVNVILKTGSPMPCFDLNFEGLCS